MLDNMIPEEMAAAVKLIQHRAIVEASGGIDEQTLAAAAAAGVDIISVGARRCAKARLLTCRVYTLMLFKRSP